MKVGPWKDRGTHGQGLPGAGLTPAGSGVWADSGLLGQWRATAAPRPAADEDCLPMVVGVHRQRFDLDAHSRTATDGQEIGAPVGTTDVILVTDARCRIPRNSAAIPGLKAATRVRDRPWSSIGLAGDWSPATGPRPSSTPARSCRRVLSVRDRDACAAGKTPGLADGPPGRCRRFPLRRIPCPPRLS